MATFLFQPTPNAEAVAFIASKPALSKEVFNKLLPELKARAFTISGIQAADVLQRARDLVATLPVGGDWADIKKGLVSEISPYFVDPESDKEEQAGQAQAAEKRAELLIRTHGQQAYAAAQYGMLDEQRDLFPFWQYLSLGDDHVRPTHAALDGVVLPADHEFWQTHFPPWEWGCRCQCVPLTRSDTVRMQHKDADKPADQQRVLNDFAQQDLTATRRLVRNGVSYNLTAPREEGKPGAFTFHPGDLRISPETLKARYDADVFAAFERWARKQPLGDLEPVGTPQWGDATGMHPHPATVWDWMDGHTIPRRPVLAPVFSEPGLHSAPAIRAAEQQLVSLKDHEEAVAVDEEGREILRSTGAIDRLEFTGAEVARLRGATLTHNHPSGQSFSRADLETSILADLAELRVVGTLPGGRAYVYSLRPRQGEWRIDTMGPLRAAYDALDAEVRSEFQAAIHAGTLTPEQAGDEHAHEIMTRLAIKYPKILRYDRTPI